MTIRGVSWRYFVILNEMILTLMREREREAIGGKTSWKYFVIPNEMVLTLMRERERERGAKIKQLEAGRVGGILSFLMRWF